MSVIDDYLAGVEESKRATLERLRKSILFAIPEAEECISYQLPAFRVKGKVVAGFAAALQKCVRGAQGYGPSRTSRTFRVRVISPAWSVPSLPPVGRLRWPIADLPA